MEMCRMCVLALMASAGLAWAERTMPATFYVDSEAGNDAAGRALEAGEAWTAWKRTSRSRRLQLLYWIGGAKRPETRARRIAELPTPRPKKVLPERAVQLLLLLDRGELMLEKRPARGIWGGLWSLPELGPDADPAAHCRDHFGFTALTQHALPRFAHSFTHFRLHIQPVKLQLSPRRTTPPGQIWLPLSDAFDVALPAPVRKLLAQIDHG